MADEKLDSATSPGAREAQLEQLLKSFRAEQDTATRACGEELRGGGPTQARIYAAAANVWREAGNRILRAIAEARAAAPGAPPTPEKKDTP